MPKYKSRGLKSKWIKTKWLLSDRNLKGYVPQTKTFNRRNLNSMLAAYATIYFKPTGGTGGFNIMRVRRKGQGYQTQWNARISYFSNLNQLYEKMSRFAGRKPYLLQQGINLARTKGNPFDIRVMVQKTNQGKWVSSAVFTKVGKPGKVATNYHQGGKLGLFSATLAGAGYNQASIRQKEASLKQLGTRVGQNFDRHLKGFRELGLDVALDAKGKTWILEVNTTPQFYPLKYMKDKSMYRRILSYAKQYGRFK